MNNPDLILDSIPVSNDFNIVLEYAGDSSISGFITNQSYSAIVETVAIRPEIIPAWYFYSVLSIVFLIAFIRTFYYKFVIEYFSSSVSYQLSLKVLNDAGIIRKRLGLLLNLVYLLSGGLYLYTILNYFDLHPFGFSGLGLLFLSILSLLMLELFRVLVAGLVAFFFDRKILFKDFMFHFFIYNKILGLVLVPFIFSIPYLHGILQDVVVYVSLMLTLSVYLVRLLRITIFVIKNVVLLFYLFLYLCVLEILPVLILIRLIMSL
jgi:hypothetical protein